MNFAGSSILSVDQFSLDAIDTIFQVADLLEPVARRRKVTRVLEGAVLGNLFFEASTRTRLSFASAFERLGGSVSDTTGFTFSSISKGESLYDTSRVISGYVDTIVIRHPEEGSVREFSEATNIPVINAGDGIGEHPTQALLDLYTINGEFKRLSKSINGSSILVFGDLKNGRTVHSLVKILALYQNIRFVFVSPMGLSLPESLLEHIASRGHHYEVHNSLGPHIKNIDVVYATRIQRERMLDGELTEGYSENFRINAALVNSLFDKNTVILHPLPRDSREGAFDLSDDLNADERLAIFRQTDNGVQIRMALFALVLGVENQIESSLRDSNWFRPQYIGKQDAKFTKLK
ncbi:aspartate carbamoyltransferase [Hahella sp. CCB-MM4]|uniref:aspartate carbamoyltransferase n=1 Tax=Hahella sp. (strain CCB-MM4) TaxID=1926491 RepID=UPI001AEF890B|nr:aspartate carbamoyltransferase [Hahella sp. CCB-MM4]